MPDKEDINLSKNKTKKNIDEKVSTISQILENKLPPHDLVAEKSLLGSLLLNSKLVDEIADKIQPDFFYDFRNGLVFKLILHLWENNSAIDILLVLNLYNLQDKKEEKLIDRDFLIELTSFSSLSSSVDSLCKIIKDKFLLRTIISTSDNMKNLALESDASSNDILDEAQKRLYEISLNIADKNFVPISQILGESFERISELFHNKSDYRGIPTGFIDIDKVLGGLHSSDLIILAARPSMGKTSLALEIARRVALNASIGVAIFSLEMSKDQLVDRMLSATSNIELYKIRSGKFSENEQNNEFIRLGEAIGKLNEAPIWIDDSGGLNILELRSKSRRLKSKENIGLIIIDYLQLMNGGSGKYGGNRVQEVSDISRGLKMLAKEMDIPILALSQLSRSVEGREDKRPMLSDLRESGSIEQDADIVMFVHREEMYHRETKKKGIADILISKHRNGATGTVELKWVQHLASFDNLDLAKITRRTGE